MPDQIGYGVLESAYDSPVTTAMHILMEDNLPLFRETAVNRLVALAEAFQVTCTMLDIDPSATFEQVSDRIDCPLRPLT